jgi:hypothetical protein
MTEADAWELEKLVNAYGYEVLISILKEWQSDEPHENER